MFKAMVIEALQEMGVKPTSKNVMVMLHLLKDVLSVVQSRASLIGMGSKARTSRRGKGSDEVR